MSRIPPWRCPFCKRYFAGSTPAYSFEDGGEEGEGEGDGESIRKRCEDCRVSGGLKPAPPAREKEKMEKKREVSKKLDMCIEKHETR